MLCWILPSVVQRIKCSTAATGVDLGHTNLSVGPNGAEPSGDTFWSRDRTVIHRYALNRNVAQFEAVQP